MASVAELIARGKRINQRDARLAAGLDSPGKPICVAAVSPGVSRHFEFHTTVRPKGGKGYK